MTRPDDRPDNDRLPTEGAHRADVAAAPPPSAADRGGAHTGRESFLGTDLDRRSPNASWGAIFAGTVTFIAVMLVLALVTGALGLSDADGTAVGIWSIIAILLALAAAGYVAGALAVRAGFLHGLVTWATSLVGIVLLVGWVGTGVLSAIGGAAGTIAQTVAEATDTTITEEVDQQDVDAAQQEAEGAAQDAQQTVAENEDELMEGAWWAVGGLIVGAIVAGFAGAAGARSAQASRAAEARAVRRA